MQWTLLEIARAVGSSADIDDRARPRDPAGIGPVTIDSRQAVAGCLFVPIVAARDGHTFVAGAVAAGAGAYLYEPGRLAVSSGGAVAAIPVDSTSQALLDIGTAARRRLAVATVVGITGSVGKTSTKDLTLAALSAGRRAVANEQSFNNELGVPLTLANAPEAAEAVVVEMGARDIGHIALLCDVAAPTVAVVTAVAGVHTEVFGSIEAVAKAKGELVQAIPADGLAVLNGDDPRVAAMRSLTAAPTVTYGLGRAESAGSPDVVAEQVTVDDELRARFRVRSPWGNVDVALAARGEHQVGNALAALTVAAHAGVPLEAAAGALAEASLSHWRMELGRTPAGVRVINDAYNANPTSTAAALRSLAQLPGGGRRLAVLGAMAELGPEGPAEHRRMAELAGDLGVEVVAFGTDAYGSPPLTDVHEAARALRELGPGDAVLVKASRSVGLERLAALLLES